LVNIILSFTTNLFILVSEKALQSVDINKKSSWNHHRSVNKNEMLCDVFGRSRGVHSEWGCRQRVLQEPVSRNMRALLCPPSYCSADPFLLFVLSLVL
jgi:hypothetical protein